MKVKCEKCGNDLSSYVDKKVIGFSVGRLTCPKCQKKQSRYISQTDLNLFLGLSEIVYLLVLLVTIILYDFTNLAYWTLLALLPLLAITIASMVQIARFVYIKAPFKEGFKNFVFNENEKQVNRWFAYRVIVFSCLAMTILSNESIKIYSEIALAITVGLCFFSFVRRLKKEKNIAKWRV